jgi:hypothetical protein
MSYMTRGRISFEDGDPALYLNDAVMIDLPGIGGPWALLVGGPDQSGIARVEFYYAAKPLEERYTDFKRRLRAANDNGEKGRVAA